MMAQYIYKCDLAANGRMETSTYFVEGETEDEAWNKGEEKLWKEWEGVDILPSKTTIEEIIEESV